VKSTVSGEHCEVVELGVAEGRLGLSGVGLVGLLPMRCSRLLSSMPYEDEKVSTFVVDTVIIISAAKVNESA
jgi:hypothetical protein